MKRSRNNPNIKVVDVENSPCNNVKKNISSIQQVEYMGHFSLHKNFKVG